VAGVLLAAQLGCASDEIQIIHTREVEAFAADEPRAGAVKNVVHDYLSAWGDRDWPRLRATLSDSVFAHGGHVRYGSAAELVAAWRSGAAWTRDRARWGKIQLLDEQYRPGYGFVLYRVEDMDSGQRYRVAESIQVIDNEITSIFAVVSPRPAAQALVGIQ
jgi:hypothetical protein